MVHAQIWTGALSIDWATPGNWNPAAVPGPTDTVTFNANTGNDPSIGAVATSVGRIDLLAGTDAEAFVGTGLLTLAGVGGIGVRNTSTQTHTFAMPMALGGDQTWESTGAGGGGLTFNGAISLDAFALTIAPGTGKTIALSTGAGDVISGTGSMIKTGAGNLTLGNVANTYSGGTTLSGGLTTIGHNANFGTGTLTLAGGSLRSTTDRILTNALVLSGPFTFSAGSGVDFTFSSTSVTGSATLTVDHTTNTGSATTLGFSGAGVVLTSDVVLADTLTQVRSLNTSGVQAFTGLISGAGQIVRNGAGGTLDLATANTHTGGTTLTSGTLRLGHDDAIGTGTLALVAGTLASLGGARLIDNAVTIGGTNTFSAGDAFTFTGATTLTANSALSVANTVTFTGVIGQSGGNRSLTKSGTGTLILSAANTYAGTTTLSAGTTRAGDNAAFGTGTLVLGSAALAADGGPRTFANAVTLGGNTTFVAGDAITFTGAATLTGTRTLTVLNSTTFAGNLGQSVASGLSKAGAGTLLLSGANTYSGTTTLSAGTLLAGSNTAFGTGTLSLGTATLGASGGARTLANAVSLAGNTTFAAGDALTFTGAATLTGNRTLSVLNTTTFSGNLGQSGTRSLTKSGAGTLLLAGANTYSGGTTLSAGTLLAGSNTAFGTGTLSLGSATLGASGGARTLANAVSLAGNTTFAAGDALTFTGAATLTGNRTLTALNTTTFSGNLGQSVASALTKAGAGTLVLAGTNTYTGGTTLSAGTLLAGSNTALGSGTLVLAGGTLGASGGPRTLANAVTLGGNVALGGSDALTLSGTLTHSGGNRVVTISNAALTTFAGNLILAENNASRTLTLDVGAGGLLITGAITAGPGSGIDTLTKSGSGTLTLGANQTYTGGLVLNGGTLDLGGFTHDVTSLNVTADSILDFHGSASSLSVDTLTVQSGVTLTVVNWTETVDAFFSQFDPGASNLSRIIFTGNGPGGRWDGFDGQVFPVPEPAATGLLLLGGTLGLVSLRRRRGKTTIPSPRPNAKLRE